MKNPENIISRIISYLNTGCYLCFYFLIFIGTIHLTSINFKFDLDFYKFSKYLLSIEEDNNTYPNTSLKKGIQEFSGKQDDHISFRSEFLTFTENRACKNFGSGLLASSESALPEIISQINFSFSFVISEVIYIKSNRKITPSNFIAYNFHKPEVLKSSILRI